MGLKSDVSAGVPIDHGGNLARAEQMFPLAPRPWIDLSTGINPHSYPYSPVPATAFSRLPEPADLERLKALATALYGAPSAGHLAAAAGTQILLPLLVEATFGGARSAGARAGILSPTYAEHSRMARLAGFEVTETSDFEVLFESDLAVVVNPNNPDGRSIPRAELLRLAQHLTRKGALLVVDEAFMDVMPPGGSVAGDVQDGLVVMRSFGKFYGLAGVRLGFAIAPPAIASNLVARLGPWVVPGPALHVANEALADAGWQNDMRHRLALGAQRLDGLLADAGLNVDGGTSLFRFVRHPQALNVFRHLGEAGILVRRFADRPDCLRIGLPADDAWDRLATALSSKNWQI